MNILYKLFKKLKIEKASLVGHSFGGRVSILFSAVHPECVEKVVLVDSAGIIPKRTLKYYYRVYKFKLLKKFICYFQKVIKRKNWKDFIKNMAQRTIESRET